MAGARLRARLARASFGSVPLAEAWRRARNLPRSASARTLAHFGVGMLVVGIVATSAYREEHILVMKPGEQLTLAGYELTFRGVAPATRAELPRARSACST